MKGTYDSPHWTFDDPFEDDDYFYAEFRRCRRRTRILRFFKHALLCIAIFSVVCLLAARG